MLKAKSQPLPPTPTATATSGTRGSSRESTVSISSSSATLSSPGAGRSSSSATLPSAIATATAAAALASDWRTVSTASCLTNVPDQLRDIMRRYFLDAVSPAGATGQGAMAVPTAGGGDRGGLASSPNGDAQPAVLTPPPPLPAGGGTPPGAYSFVPRDGTYATPLSSMIALTQLTAFSRSNQQDEGSAAASGCYDHIVAREAAAGQQEQSAAAQLPAFAFANYGFFPALDHHREMDAAHGGGASSGAGSAGTGSGNSPMRNNNNKAHTYGAPHVPAFDSSATLVNSLLLSDVTQNPPSMFERGLRELANLVEASRPSSSASATLRGNDGGNETTADGDGGFLQDMSFVNSPNTNASPTLGAGADSPVGGNGGGAVSPGGAAAATSVHQKGTTTIVQDGAVIHRLLHGAIRELLVISQQSPQQTLSSHHASSSTTRASSAARSLIPWVIRTIAPWEFCDANTRATMCFNFLQSCLPMEDPNHVSVVLETWSRIVVLDHASHAIYHDAASCLLMSSLEWLFLDAKAPHRVSALCVISHVVRQGSRCAHLLHLHRGELLQAMWNALTDMQSWIRELAAGTLQLLLTALLDRNYRERADGNGGNDDNALMEGGIDRRISLGGPSQFDDEDVHRGRGYSPPMSPLSDDERIFNPGARGEAAGGEDSEEDADVRALVMQALAAFTPPAAGHHAVMSLRHLQAQHQHGRVMSWSSGALPADEASRLGPMSDTGSMTDSFTANSPSAASAAAGTTGTAATSGMQQNVVHAGALVLGALLGADRQIRLAHRHRGLGRTASLVKLERVADQASTEVTDEHSEIGSSEHRPTDAEPGSGQPSAMFLPPPNDSTYFRGTSRAHESLNSIGGSGNNVASTGAENGGFIAAPSVVMMGGVVSADLSPASMHLGAPSEHVASGEFRGGLLGAAGRNSSGSSVMQSPVPGIGGTWSAPPGSPESLDPVLHVRHGGHSVAAAGATVSTLSQSPPQQEHHHHTRASNNVRGHRDTPTAATPAAAATRRSPASAFLKDDDIRQLLTSILSHRKKPFQRMYGCRLIPLIAAFHPTLLLADFGQGVLNELVGFAQNLKALPLSSSLSIEKLQEDRANVLTCIGLLYRAFPSSMSLPPNYHQELHDSILPLIADYLSAPTTLNQHHNGNAGSNASSSSLLRVDAAATSLALIVGSLDAMHRTLCEELIQALSSMVLAAPHLTIETAGATAELYHLYPSLRHQAHTGLLRLITDSLRQTFFALPPAVHQQQQQQQLASQRRQQQLALQRQLFADDLLVPGAVNTRLTAFHVLHNLSCTMSWSGAAMYFLENCSPYLYHPDARVRRGCIECCGPMLTIDCTTSTMAVMMANHDVSLASPSASFAPWDVSYQNRSQRYSYVAPVSPPLGSQGVLEAATSTCDLSSSGAMAAATTQHRGRSHVAILHRIVGRLMDVAVADSLPELRRAALQIFVASSNYDALLVGHSAALSHVFQLLSDPCVQNRHMALSIATRLTTRVPSFASPRLRGCLAGVLDDLSSLTAKNGRRGVLIASGVVPLSAMSVGGLAGVEERLLLLFQLLHSVPLGVIMPIYLPVLLQILQNVLGADSPVSASATAVALSMVHFLLEESPEQSWGSFMAFYVLAVRHVDGNHQGKMLSALNLLQALVKCVATVHSNTMQNSGAAGGELEDAAGDNGPAEQDPSPSGAQAATGAAGGLGERGGAASRVTNRRRSESVAGDGGAPRRHSSSLLLSRAGQSAAGQSDQQQVWMVTEAQLQATANLLHGWMRQRTVVLSAGASIAIMKLLGTLTAVEPLPSQPFVPVMEGGMDGVDSRRRADAAVGLEESRVVCDGSRGWPFEVLQYLLSVLAGNVVPLNEEDQRLTIAAILRIFHSTPSVARHFHAFIGPFFRLLERLLQQARFKAYADGGLGDAASATATATSGSSTTATYVSLLETVFSAIAQLLMSPDVSRSTYAHAPTIVRMARTHWDAQRPALLSRLCDVLSALNRQATEPLQEYVAWFVASLLSALVQCCPKESKRELTIKVLMSIESFRGASTSNTLLLVVPTLCQILNTPNIPDDAKRHVGKALVRFIFSCDANPFIARVVECCSYQLQLSERAFAVERARVQAQIRQVFTMRDAKKRAALEADLGQVLADAAQVAFSAVRTSSLPRILINYSNIGHTEVKQFPTPPAPPTTAAEAQQLMIDIVGQRLGADIPCWLHPWEAEIVAVVCAAAGRCNNFDEYHATMVDRLGARFGARSDVVRFFNSCANPSSHATLQRPIAVVASSTAGIGFSGTQQQFYLTQQSMFQSSNATGPDDTVTPTQSPSTGGTPEPLGNGAAARQRLTFDQAGGAGGSRDATSTPITTGTHHLLPPLAGGGGLQQPRGGAAAVPQVYRKQSSLTPSSTLPAAVNNRSFHSPSVLGGASTPLDMEPDPMFLRTPLVSGHQLPHSAVKNPALFQRGGASLAPPAALTTPVSSTPGSPEKGMSRQATHAMTMAGSGIIPDSQCGTPLLSPTAYDTNGGGGREDEYPMRSSRIPVLQRHDNSSLDDAASPVPHHQQLFQQPKGVMSSSSGVLVAGAVNGSGSTSALLLSPSKLQYRPDAAMPPFSQQQNSRTLSNTHLYTPTATQEPYPTRQRDEQRRDLQAIFEQHKKAGQTTAEYKAWFEQLVAKVIQRSRHVYISACDELSRRHYVIACAVFPFAMLSYLTTCDLYEREEWLGLINDLEKRHRNDRSSRRIPMEIMREISRLAYAIRRDAAVLFPSQPQPGEHAARFLPNETVIRLAQRALEIPIAVTYLEEDVLIHGQWDKSPTLLELYDHAGMRQEVHALRLQPNFHLYLLQNPHVITPELLETLGDVEAAIQLYDVQQRPAAHDDRRVAPFVSLESSGTMYPRRNTTTQVPRAVTAGIRQGRSSTVAIASRGATGSIVTLVPTRRQNSSLGQNTGTASAMQSPSLGPMMEPSPRVASFAHSPGALEDDPFLLASGNFTLQPPPPSYGHHRASQHHLVTRWNHQSKEEQAANGASAVLRCLNQGFQFRRTLAYYQTMKSDPAYRGLTGGSGGGGMSRARGSMAAPMHPDIARHVALAAHCLGDWDIVREVCTSSGVKRSTSGSAAGLQRYGSMSSEHGIPYPTKHFVSKELLLFSAASDVARGYYDEALETLERLRELLMDAATVLHAESSKRRMDLNLMMLSMTDLEEAMHALKTRSTTAPTGNNATVDSSLPPALSDGHQQFHLRIPQHGSSALPARLITIGHRSLPSQASALHVMQAISFRAAFVPRSKQLRNLFVLCELLTAEGQQDRAQEVLRESLRGTGGVVGGGGAETARSHNIQRLRALAAGDNRSFPSSTGLASSSSFDPSQFEHQAITLECLKIGLETAGCSPKRLQRLHVDVQDALRSVATYVEEHTTGAGLVSPLSTIATNPSITMPQLSSPDAMFVGVESVGHAPSEGHPALDALRWTHRSSSATATTNQHPQHSLSRGTLEFRVELETLDLEITRRLTGFHQYPTTRRGGRDAPRPSYATPLLAQDGQKLGLWMLTSEPDDRDLSVFMSRLYKSSEVIVEEHHSVTDANFATSLKEFSLLYFDVCKALRAEWVDLHENGSKQGGGGGGGNAGSGDEALQVLQNFLTTSSQCVTALQRAAAMCVKSFDHATTATVHSLQQQQQQQQLHAAAAMGGDASAASPTSQATSANHYGQSATTAGGTSGLAVNIAGAGHLAYSSRRRVASARANITVSDLLLKALNTAWNGNCLHDLSLAPDMLPSWALLAPFLAHYASRSKSVQQIVTQMCQQSLGMLSQMSFYLVSSFETVGLRWLPPLVTSEPTDDDVPPPTTAPHGHHHHHKSNVAAASTSPKTASLLPPPPASSDGVPSPLSRATSNVTSRMVRTRSVMQPTGSDRPHKSHHQHHNNAAAGADEDMLDLPLELDSTLGGWGGVVAPQLAPLPIPPPGDANHNNINVTPHLGGTATNNLSLALAGLGGSNLVDNASSGSGFQAPFVLTSPDALQPSRGQSFTRYVPPAMEGGLGASMNIASAGSASTLFNSKHLPSGNIQPSAAGTTTAPPPTATASVTTLSAEAAAAGAQLRLHASLGPHMNMGAWWDLQQRAIAAAVLASRSDRRGLHHQQHRLSNATTAFGATAPSQVLRSLDRSGIHHNTHAEGSHDDTRSPIHHDDDGPQLLQLFPQGSMNEGDEKLVDIEQLAGMSLNSPPPYSRSGTTMMVDHAPDVLTQQRPTGHLLVADTPEKRADMGDDRLLHAEGSAELLPPPPPLLPHRSMRQRSNSIVFMKLPPHDSAEDSSLAATASITRDRVPTTAQDSAEAPQSPQPALSAVGLAAAAAQATLNGHQTVTGDFGSWSPHEAPPQGGGRRRSNMTNATMANATRTATTAVGDAAIGAGGANNAQAAAATLPALHHEVVLDIAKTSPQHRSLVYTTLRFSRWMAGGEASISFVESSGIVGRPQRSGAQATTATVVGATTSLTVPVSAAAQSAGPPQSSGAPVAAMSAWGTGLRGCPLPLPTWHVRQQCSKPIAARATVLSARRVAVTSPAPPFASEELVWMTLSDGTTLKFHHGLTPSLHTAPPKPSKPQPAPVDGGSIDLVGFGVAGGMGAPGGDAQLSLPHRVASYSSIADLAAPPAQNSTVVAPAAVTTAQKKARRADEKQDALQQHVHTPLCSCHPAHTTGSAPLPPNHKTPYASLNSAQHPVHAQGTAVGAAEHNPGFGTPLADFGRFEDVHSGAGGPPTALGGGALDNLSPLSSIHHHHAAPPPPPQHHQQMPVPLDMNHYSLCDTCGGKVQGKPYATMSAALNSVIEHLPLHHMRRSLVIPFSPVNALSQIMTPIPIVTAASMSAGGSANVRNTTIPSAVAAGRPRYVPLRHVTMTSLYHLLDAYSGHRLREETTAGMAAASGSDNPLIADAKDLGDLFASVIDNGAVGGGAAANELIPLVVPASNSATTTRRQRVHQVRIADYFDSGGVAFKSNFEGVEATIEDLRKVFSEEDVKDDCAMEQDGDGDDTAAGRSRSEQTGGTDALGTSGQHAAAAAAAAAQAAALSLATRVNLVRLYRAKPQQYLRQLMVLEAQDPSQWISSRTVFAKQLAEWSVLQYLFDISCRCPSYFVVDLASGHITQLEVGLHAMPPPPTAAHQAPHGNNDNPEASGSGDFRSMPSSAASPPSAAASSSTTGPPMHHSSVMSGTLTSQQGSVIRSNLATRDPCTFRMTTTLQNALPMRSPYSGFLLYASEGLRQTHLVKKELIGLLEYGLEGIRVRQRLYPPPQFANGRGYDRGHRRSTALSGRSSPSSDFGGGMSATSYRLGSGPGGASQDAAVIIGSGGTPPLVTPPPAFGQQQQHRGSTTFTAVDTSGRRGSEPAGSMRRGSEGVGLLSMEPFNASFADSDKFHGAITSGSPPHLHPGAAAGDFAQHDHHHHSGSQHRQHNGSHKDDDWAPVAPPALEADEEGYSIACFDVSSAIIRLNESLSVASTTQTKQRYDHRKGVVVLSSPSLSPPPPKRPPTVEDPNDNINNNARRRQSAAADGAAAAEGESSVDTTRSTTPAVTTTGGGLSPSAPAAIAAHLPSSHPLTKPLDSFEDFIGSMHAQAATKIQRFVRNWRRCRRLVVAARRMRRRGAADTFCDERPLGGSLGEDEDNDGGASLGTGGSSFAAPRMLNMSLTSTDAVENRAGASGGSFSMARPRTVSLSLGGAGGSLQSPPLTFQAHLNTPSRLRATANSSGGDADNEGFDDLPPLPPAAVNADAAGGGESNDDSNVDGNNNADVDDAPRPCSDTLIPGVTYTSVRTYQQRVEALIEAAMDEENIAGRHWDHGTPHPWLVWCPYW